jgi:formylglycine-generating enzyme required for sulfatase activity
MQLHKLCPNVILMSGDVASSGEPEQYQLADEWLVEVAQQVGLDRQKVLLVPGDHDVLENGDRKADRLVRSLREGKERLDDVLKDPTDRQLLGGRLAPYLAFAANFGPSKSDTEPFNWAQGFDPVGDVRVCIVGLNTALLCTRQTDKGKLQAGFDFLETIAGNKQDADLLVMLSHHPFGKGWLSGDRDEDNGLHQLVHDMGPVHLTGHVEDADSVSPGPQSIDEFVRVTGSPLYEDGESRGYNFVQLLRKEDDALWLRIHPRKWSDRKKVFMLDAENVIKGQEFSEHRLRQRPAMRASRSEIDVGTLRRLTDEKARVEAAEAARKAVEEKARSETAEAARKAADERARAEAAEAARKAADEKAGAESAEAARKAAEEKARAETAEAAHKAADEKARAESAEAARKAADEKARAESVEAARKAADEKARAQEARKGVDEKTQHQAAHKPAKEKSRTEAAEAASQDARAEATRRPTLARPDVSEALAKADMRGATEGVKRSATRPKATGPISQEAAVVKVDAGRPQISARNPLLNHLVPGTMVIAALGGGWAIWARLSDKSSENASDVRPSPSATAPRHGPTEVTAMTGVPSIEVPPPAAMCSPGMVAIDGGLLPPGRPETPDERAEAFCIDRTEVTVRAYRACTSCSRPVSADAIIAWEPGIKNPTCNWEASEKDLARLDHPINCVTWELSNAYCQSRGFRLPTALEWELASQGKNRKRWQSYPWGADEPRDQFCWSGAESRSAVPGRTTCAVQSMLADRSEWGVHDLGGNVMEWVQNSSGRERLLKGAGWRSTWQVLDTFQVSRHFAFQPDQARDYIGFRCAAARQGPK